MRIRTGHRPEDWSDNAPASAFSGSIRGALVIGGPGPYDTNRNRDYQRKHKAKLAAAALEAEA